jgi:Limiting CO2-inducible proteins B/C beta carbonyic anhydrases
MIVMASSKRSKPFSQVQDKYPGALTNAELLAKMKATLAGKGFDASKSLVATSLCCDEVNRPLESDLAASFDTNFNMGGLAGFPFGGATSFGAMASHIPDGGDCVVVYGPHVGIDFDSKVGTVPRRGKNSGGSCCGSAVAASGYVSGVRAGGEEAVLPDDPLDAQQYFVGTMLMPYAERLEKAADKMQELPLALYDAQTDLMKQIVGKSASAVAGNGKIAVLGGVQINTPPGYSDYFLPKSFNLYDNKGKLVEKLWK